MIGERRSKQVLVAIAAGLIGVGAAWAQVPGERGAGPGGMEPLRGFARLHKELNLNPQQEALWNKARSAQRDAFRSMRASGEAMRAKLRVEIDKPGADLKAFAQMRDELGAQMRAQMESSRQQVRTAWFAVYDALDSTQKEQVRVAIRDGMDRRGRGAQRFHHRHGPQGGPVGQAEREAEPS